MHGRRYGDDIGRDLCHLVGRPVQLCRRSDGLCGRCQHRHPDHALHQHRRQRHYRGRRHEPGGLCDHAQRPDALRRQLRLGHRHPDQSLTDTAGTPITVGSEPWSIAITPNGHTAYVTNEASNSVTPINLSNNTAGAAIAVGSTPWGIAITPNGQTAYVANSGSGTVTPINLSNNTPGTPIAVGNDPQGIAITPNGQTAYVANEGSGTVTPITISTNTPGTPISAGSAPWTSPSPRTARPPMSPTCDFGHRHPDQISSPTPPAAPSPSEMTPAGVAFAPNGQTAYVSNQGSGTVIPITVATNTAGTAITVASTARGIAFTPDQAPTASFSVTPASPEAPTSFNGSASGAPYGSITNYAWTFGDGNTANTSTPTTTHTYTTAGTFTATLTVTDSAGTSTTQVFTGQDVLDNGAASAMTSQSFTLPLGVSAISPITGPVGGGTVVTITGTSFVPGSTTVQFGATAATSVTCSSTTSCTATSPPGSTGIVDVTVTAGGVTSSTWAGDQFGYGAVPFVTAVIASSGPTSGGQRVTLIGANLANPSSVHFGSSSATIVSSTATTVTVTSPSGTLGSTVDVTVTTSGVTSPTSSADQYSYVAAPTAYVVSNAGTITPITISTNTAGSAITVGSGTNPIGTAITPNGQTLYVANYASGTVTPINLSTNTAGTPITVGTNPREIAITPNGQTAYVVTSGSNTVTPITIATNTPGTAIAVGSNPWGIAITPNGQTAYVTNSGSNTVTPITIATNTPGTAISGLSGPLGIAITPNGQTAYVTDSGSNTVSVLTIGTNTVGTAIAVGTYPVDIAITPNGQTAYVTNQNSNTVTPITIASNTAGSPISIGGATLWGVSITPNGQTAYVASQGGGTVTPITIPANTVGTAISVTGARVIAITPDQAPTASFTVTPGSPGSATSFNASASGAPYGSITNYAWTFGDTNTANTSTPTTTHTYATAGLFTASLTVTDTAGSSTTQVFTGQDVLDNGAASATSSQSFTLPPSITAVSPAAGPIGGGTVVTITGTGFIVGATTIAFGSSAGTSVSCSSTTSCTATSPAESAGTVDITATNAGGTSSTSSADQFTFDLAPTVGAISPDFGPLSAGTVVTITGTGFVVGSSTVAFGGSAGTSVSCSSSTSCTATSPAESAGVVDITVTTPGGTSATSPADHFAYDTTPTVTGITPAAGPIAGGTIITIIGTGLAAVTGVGGVTFAGTDATSYTINSDTSITATAPARAAGVVDVSVTGGLGTSSTSSADHFTYDVVPTVTSVSPNAGPIGGGTAVTITGTGFVVGSSTVAFGGSAGTAVSCSSSTSCSATSPAESAGVVDITVTTPGGTSSTSSADHFTYDVVPTVTSVSPNAGPIGGGTAVTITGTGFVVGSSTVAFGGSAGTAVSCSSSTSCSATSPAESAGVVDITVTTPGGTSSTSSADHFTYNAVPTVTGISPNAGPIGGGTAVTITGTGFVGSSTVAFGGSAGTAVSCSSSTSCSATSPAESAGVVDITVTTPGGTSSTSSADHFTYNAVPTVTGISPNAGGSGGTDVVTIAGTGFVVGSSTVSFGGSAGTAVSCSSSTTCTATSPSHAAGAVDVTVTTPGGSSATSSADKFIYDTTPSVTAVSPNAGPIGGGTVVTITGTGLADTTGVDFAGNPASYTIVSDTSITATSPSGSAGVADITVTNETGTSSTSAADHFSYDAVPTVTGVSPNAGGSGGTDIVTITGTGFVVGSSTVSFGGSAGTSVSCSSSTTCTATSPAKSASVVNVTVTTPGGTSATSSADKFTYDAAPSVTGISPNAGPIVGGTVVTITGTGLADTTGVDFAGTNAASYTINSDTSVTATSPSHVAGVADITVTNETGTSSTSSADHFSYDAVPTVTGISPNAGGTGGTDVVTITGTGFVVGSSTVAFGGSAGTSVSCSSSTTCAATSPSGSAGVVDVTVTTPGGTSATSSADKFTYDTTPSVTGISPSAGPIGGGTVVTITGTGLADTTGVSFAGNPASGYTIVSDTSITAISPSGSAGVADITVTNETGTSSTSSADHFTYNNSPGVDLVSPSAGPIVGGTVVTITGTGFVVGSGTVAFGSTAGTSVSCSSTTTCTATSPAHAAGAVDVTVSTPGGSSATSTDDKFTYDTTPSVTAVSPNAGPIGGGTVVTITGSGFADTTGVDFAGNPAASYTINSDTSITATSPSGSAGVADITVTNETGSSSTGLADQFSYDAVPSITGINPGTGGTGGGDVVTITGTVFVVGSSTVSFGGSAGTAVSCSSSTTCTATSPSGSAGVVNVTVTTPGGTSATSSADQFTYDTTPTVTAVSPNAGPIGGGTVVTITGTGLVDATGAYFAGDSATSYTINSDTSITATSPSHVAGVADITVTNETGTSSTSTADKFSYDVVPNVTGIDPGAGGTGGTDVVTITGTGFVVGLSTVAFGRSAGTSVSCSSSTTCTATSPAEPAGVVDVSVTTPGGTNATSSADKFTYDTTPRVTGVTPSAGPIGGGTVVTITGTGLADTTGVSFAGNPAASYTIVSDTSVTATSPPGSPGVADITVTNETGTSSTSSADDFTYNAAQSISFTSTPASPVAGSTYAISAVGGASGEPVIFSVDPSGTYGSCSLSDQTASTNLAGDSTGAATVSFNATGTCVLDADQAGSSGYLVASQAQQTIVIGQASQGIIFASTPPADPAVGGSYTPLASGGASGNPVVFSIDSSGGAGVCALSGDGSTVSFGAVGACVLDANQAGSSSYLVAPQAQQTIVVGQASQGIIFSSNPPAHPAVGGSYTPLASGGASGNPVVFSIDSSSGAGVCALSGDGSTVSFSGVGACVIDANQAGSSDYLVATQAEQIIGVGRASQTITFTSSPPNPVVGSSYVPTATGGASGNPVVFSIDSLSGAGVCSLSSDSSTVSFNGSGTCLIDANEAASSNYFAAAETEQIVVVAPASQGIIFSSTPPADPAVGGSYTPLATGGASGNPVVFSIDSSSGAGTCALSGDGLRVNFGTAGACVLDANQAGSSAYLAAPQAQQIIVVAPASQGIIFSSTPPADPAVGGSYTPHASGGASGNPVVFSIDSSSGAGVCSLSGDGLTVSFNATGTCVLDANQAGSSAYLVAPQAQQIIVVPNPNPPAGGGGPAPSTPVAQTITFTSQPPAAPSVGDTYTISATAPGGPVSFALDAASSGCSLGGTVVTFTGVGTCVIDASAPANDDYLAASASQSIVINPPSNQAGLGSITSVTATAGDGQVLVSWSAPSNASGFNNVRYTVVATPGGENCSTTGSLSCLVTGLTDSVSYTFTVAASSDDPTSSSIISAASSPVTPTDAAFQNGTTTSELSPGTADVIEPGGSTTKIGVTLSGDSVTATGQGLQLVIATSATTGSGSNATVVLITGGSASFSGSGFFPGSTVEVFAFSKGTLLGTAVVKPNGKYSVTLRVPVALVVGSHTIELQGLADSHKKLAVAVGVAVSKRVAQSIVIGNFGTCASSLNASMKAQLNKLATAIHAQGASLVVITGYTYSTSRCAKTLGHTQATAVASYLRASLKHHGYNKALRMVIRVGRAASQALSRRVTVAVTLGQA